MVLPEVFQVLCCPCLPLLHRVMLFYHLPYPARAVKSLKEVIVSLVFQLLPGKVSLHEDRQLRDLGVAGIGDVATEIIDLEHEIRLTLVVRVPGRQSLRLLVAIRQVYWRRIPC